jgi:hypothetical protein
VETLFRFIVSRPAQAVDSGATTVAVRLPGDYEKKLEAARSSENPVPAVRRVAAAYRSSAGNWTPASLAFFAPLTQFMAALDSAPTQTLAALHAAFDAAFGQTAPAALVKNGDFVEAGQKLGAIVVTGALLGHDGTVTVVSAAELLRAMAVIERLAKEDASLAEPNAIAAATTKTLLLPAPIFPLLGSPATESDGQAPSKPAPPDASGLLAKRDQLLLAYAALTRVGPESVALTKPTTTTHAVRGPTGTKRNGGAPIAERDRAQPVLLTTEALQTFDADEQRALTELKVDPTKTSLTAAVPALSYELSRTEAALGKLADRGIVRRVGSNYYPAGGLLGNYGAPASPPSHLPSTHGSFAPAGIADLLVVKQFLKRYEAYEESHIENILKGEYKELVHTRTDLTELTTTTTDEVDKEEDRDLQTTERYELQTETDNTIKDDSSLKAGVALSGSYGPMVEFKATTDFATSSSKEQAAKVSTDYSKEVVQKASSKLIEKHSQQVVAHYVTKVKEKNTHGFDNKAGDGPVVGQYQWVDKIYEAQVFNYGKRMLYDLMLPEPAAFVLYAATQPSKAQAELVKPDPFTLTPADITEWNYPTYVAKYAAAGVTPPPPAYVTSSKAIEAAGDGNNDWIGTKSADVPVTDGYQAISATVWTLFVTDDTDNAWVGESLGSLAHEVTFTSGTWWSATMHNETGTVSFTAALLKIKAVTINIDLVCQRTSATLDAWKLKTHGAILQAYQQQLRDYQDQLAALQQEATQQAQGVNPSENEKLVRNELKKGAISLFTDQQYDWIDGITTSPQGYPEVNLANADSLGSYVRFFEQAFEWEEMMYFFYPYYWGRKDGWLDRIGLQDVDPLFADFLKAGAARCVLPVRPGFEAALAYFMQTGQIWNGGDLPTVTDPLYVSIIEEIKESEDAPGDEVPQGDPWEVRLPTTLVFLRDQDTLPSWHKTGDGTWVPD